MPEFEVMVLVESCAIYTVEADSKDDAMAEAREMFSASDVDVQEADITNVLCETYPGSAHFE